jgi:hypothetical protein
VESCVNKENDENIIIVLVSLSLSLFLDFLYFFLEDDENITIVLDENITIVLDFFLFEIFCRTNHLLISTCIFFFPTLNLYYFFAKKKVEQNCRE